MPNAYTVHTPQTNTPFFSYLPLMPTNHIFVHICMFSSIYKNLSNYIQKPTFLEHYMKHVFSFFQGHHMKHTLFFFQTHFLVQSFWCPLQKRYFVQFRIKTNISRPFYEKKPTDSAIMTNKYGQQTGKY